MFVQINDSCIINTNHIVSVVISDKKRIVKMSDGTEHVTNAEKLDSALKIINRKERS